MRRLIIGDIHACRDELLELVAKAGIGDDDEIIALGDLVDRGPDPAGVLAFIRSRPNTRSIMGNHERKNIRGLRGEVVPARSQRITRHQLGEDAYAEACAWMEQLPLFIELDNALLVHGFMLPGLPVSAQPENVLLGTLSGERKVEETCGDREWYELYEGEKPVIVGHRVYFEHGRPLIHRDRVFGLDTGCCRGGMLTGFLLPEFRIVQVPARENHWERSVREYAEASDVPIRKLTWDEARKIVRRRPARDEEEEPGAESYSARVATCLAEGEEAIRWLFDHIRTTHEALLRDLRSVEQYDELPPDQQARRYAARVSSNRIAPWLHHARLGRLTEAYLLQGFKGPHPAVSFCRALQGDPSNLPMEP